MQAWFYCYWSWSLRAMVALVQVWSLYLYLKTVLVRLWFVPKVICPLKSKERLPAQVEQKFSSLEGINQSMPSSEGGQLVGQMDASRDQISLILVELTPRARAR